MVGIVDVACFQPATHVVRSSQVPNGVVRHELLGKHNHLASTQQHLAMMKLSARLDTVSSRPQGGPIYPCNYTLPAHLAQDDSDGGAAGVGAGAVGGGQREGIRTH